MPELGPGQPYRCYPIEDSVVAVGMGLAVPGASSPDQFWRLLGAGVPQFGEPGDRMDIDALWSPDPAAADKTYTRVSGFIRDFQPHPRLREELAAGSWSPGELTGQWLRHSLWQALDRVTVDGARTYLAIGMTPDGGHAAEQTLLRYGARLLAGGGDPLAGSYPDGAANLATHAPHRVVADAVAGLVEPVETTILDTACSSSLYAFDLGMRALREGRAELALCGGAYAVNALNLVLFSKLDGLSKTGTVRALGRDPDGVLFSDGAAVVALKTYRRAVVDGDPILGFVRGFGGSSDGRGKAVYAPNPAGQRFALERAWAAAGVEPSEVDWLVAHATGTAAGDAAELVALRAAAPGKRWTLTSNKALIGHTGWAAGAVNVIHALLALHRESIPGQHLTGEPVADDGSVHVPTGPLPWPAGTGRARTVAVSAMGFGGTNAHLVISDQPAAAPSPAAGPADEPVAVVASTGLLPAAGAALDRDLVPPEPLQVRLPPTVLARMDRSQQLALRCALDLRGPWAGDRDLLDRTGVFVGHTGQVRQALVGTLRAYLDDLRVRAGGGFDLDRFAAAARSLGPESNHDSLPGLMPNIIASRIAQLLDLHGPNMTLDAGPDSGHSALGVACRQLAAGALDAAVVVGMTPDAGMVDSPAVCEAVAGVLLMRRATAEARGLPVLGELRTAAPAIAPPAAEPDFGAAAAVVAIHRTILDTGGPVALEPASRTSPAIRFAPAPAAGQPDRIGELERHLLVLRELSPPAVRPPLAALPARTLLLTNAPARLAGVDLPADCVLAGPGTIAAESLEQVLEGRPIDHLRVIFDAAAPAVDGLPDGTLALHDLTFAAARHCADAVEERGSLAVLALDPNPVATAATGLFTGLVRALRADLPAGLVYAVVADTDPDVGLELLGVESARNRHLGVAYYRDGVRREAVVVRSPGPDPAERRELPAGPVLVATGGGRGITVELVDQLARHTRPAAIWLLGSGPAPLAGVAEQLPPDRTAALRRLMAEHPGEKVAALNGRYDRWRQTVERARTIDRLAARHGVGIVHYRQCDVLDPAAVARVAAEVGHADIVVHGAGLEQAAALRRKRLDQFRAVRDVKVRGWLHLRAAFAAAEPPLWFALSSATTLVARPGEADYISANEFLICAADAERADGRDAHALISGLWVETGMVTATNVQGAYLAREGTFTHLDDETGRGYFAAEITRRPAHARASVWLGETEWRMLAAFAPELRAEGERPARQPFLPGPGRSGPGGTVWEVEIGLDDHPYLLDHRVDGRPTLPGTFILEIAAEAARRHGRGRVVAIEDAEFSRFIRAGADQWPRPLVVQARGGPDRVEVTVSSPGRGPVPAQRYAGMTVALADAYPSAPPAVPAPDGAAAGNPYAAADSPVGLTGWFDSLRDQRVGPPGGSARLALPAPAGLEPLAGFTLPALAMDSLLRAAAAVAPGTARAAVPVPVRLGRVDLYTGHNDASLAGASGPIELRYWFALDRTPTRCEAVDARGRMLFACHRPVLADKRRPTSPPARLVTTGGGRP